MRYDSGLRRYPKAGSPITRRAFLAGGAAFATGLAAYSSTIGRHQLEISHHTLSLKNLPDTFVGFRIVQISDIHLKEYTETWFLEKVVAEVNALNPDLILLTGDFISRGPLPTSYAFQYAGIAAEILSGLQAPQRYAIIGNHEAAVGPGRIIDTLRAHGTPFLVDSYVPIERGYERIWLGGTDDASFNKPDLGTTLPHEPRVPVILMCHEPDYIDTLALDPRFAAVDVMLSGHSHGGQVRLPILGPLILPSLGRKYVQGLYQVGNTKLYVNRGIGTVGLPFRFHCPSEITHFTLMRDVS
jgi:predicted MPP superfamily phosphohydrolase